MSNSMQYELPSPSRNRKRSSAWLTEDEDISQVYTSIKLEDTPSKRLQNSRGEAVHSKPLLRYNAPKLLNNLAFTRFYVTKNFQNFNPSTSFIILCMVSEQNGLYQALCISPDLQALAITAGYVSPNSMSDQSLLRELPLVTTACVDGITVEEFEHFRQEVGGPQGCIAVISPECNCVWNSSESFGADISTHEDLMSLQWQLVNAVGGGNAGDVAMGDG
ncbi:hypothetical protein LTR37_009058 [Vermiconidia calcicola]|uniref:Uncharacterized protein n=1 Tax=Vermiconidia calcicola TaxID=1690605 RepID=A0ACC3N9H2_9PEZI|nr:hypothetical protein LTR37_009058 [Vermiconidia calcicola]